MISQNLIFIFGLINIFEVLCKVVDMLIIDYCFLVFGWMLYLVFEGVKQVLKICDVQVFLFFLIGMGGWEIVIINMLLFGDKVLVVCNGMFSYCWIDMCQCYGLDVDFVEIFWGEGILVDRFQDILIVDKGYQICVVLVIYNEIVIGVVFDIVVVCWVLDVVGYLVLLFVDGVSLIGLMDFCMDDWGVDIVVIGSQKGFMLFFGLVILGFLVKVMVVVESVCLFCIFFDICDMVIGYVCNGYFYMLLVGLINGLNYVCDRLLFEGLENVFVCYCCIVGGVCVVVVVWGLEFCVVCLDLYFDSVSVICVFEGFDVNCIVSYVLDIYDMVFGIGFGEVVGKVFCIGYLGSLIDVMVLLGIVVVEMIMVDLGLNVCLGLGVVVVQEYYC